MKKLLIPMLWVLSILTFFISAFVGRLVNITSDMYSETVVFVSFNLALTAMLLQTIKNKGITYNPYILKMDRDTREKAIKNMFISKMTFVIVGFIANLYIFLTKVF